MYRYPHLRILSIVILCLLLRVEVEAAETNRIVIRVNDRIATLFDYQQRRDERIDSIRRSPQLSPKQVQERLARAGEDTLKEIYEELLVLSRADQLDVRISASDIDRAMARMKESYGIKSEAEFQQALQSFGMTAEIYREQIRTNLMIREVMGREVNSRIDLEEEDLRRYYRSHPEEFEIPSQVNLREVVILQADSSEVQESAKLATEIRERLSATEDFEAVVGPYAETGATSNVIELGWVHQGDLESSLDAAAWNLSEGEISEPVLARGGLHLVQLLAKKESAIKPFKEVEDEIRSREENRVYQEQLSTFIDELEAKSYVEVHPPPETPGITAELLSRSPDDPLAGADPLDVGQIVNEQDSADRDEEVASSESSEPSEPSAPSSEPSSGQPNSQ
jgi:peptidyl-prolyl cis-trans isomerase SurA